MDYIFVYENIYDGACNHVVAENRNSTYPVFAAASENFSKVNSVDSSFWRVSTTQIRLSRLTLAYSLPKQWLKSIGISSVRFNVTGQNLFSFCNPYPDNFFDPMSGTYGKYPSLRNITIGVNVTF